MQYLRYEMRDTRCASRSARTSAQKELIMQNKPNFPDAQMNISSVLTKDYENVPLHRHRQNKANQTQFKPNFHNAKMKQNFKISSDG